MATEKIPFYVAKPDDKYTVLNRSIGIDTNTSYLSTRTINPSNSVAGTTVGNLTGTLLGKTIDFDFSTSPTSYFDWNNSCMECRFHIATAAGTAAITAADDLLQWNNLFSWFDEMHVQINGQTILSKTAGDYCYTQTMKLISEHTKESLEASTAIFAPVGDELYTSGFDGMTALGTKSAKRNLDWLPGLYTDVCVKMPTFRDLFFSFPGLSKNIRNIKISFKINAAIPLAHRVATTCTGCILPVGFYLQLHEYNYSPSSSISALDGKIKQDDEHLALIDVDCRKMTFSSDMTVTNQKDVQWIAMAQFANETANIAGSYTNCGNTMLLNGYSTTALATTTILERADVDNTTHCYAPPSTMQVSIGGFMYPYNAMITQKPGNASLLNHAELYREYCRGVQRLTGNLTAAIDEATFKRTMPFLFVKPTANNKLLQTSDILIRAPGFGGDANTAAKSVRIFYGKLKGFIISPSGTVSEAISSY